MSFGLHSFPVMPFELHGVAVIFQRLMDRVLLSYGRYAAAYLDDVVIYSSDWDSYLHHVTMALAVDCHRRPDHQPS